MKRLVKYTLIGLLFVSSVATSFAQKGKFAHINSNELLLAMPERKDAEKTIQAEAQKMEAQLEAMSKEYQAKVAEYQAEAATMSDLIKETKAGEIQDLEVRIQQFQASAQEALQVKESELLAPLVEKAKTAISSVANENGYSYVFDSSLGVLVHMPDGDNILPLVKKKLGITTP